ncbi:MAG TPA: hypothetical protein VKF17_02510 [Isosphaeraceae bacterium]|nr:hypothetical protein [Isosphaeraceae bacterium]
MSKDEGPADLLVEAIGEFRQELIEWIDFQLNLLCEREAWPITGSAGAVAPANVLAARPEPQAATAPVAVLRVVAQSSEPAEAAESPAQPDSRHRLDAVARRLGERLRLSEESRKGPERTDRDDVAEDQRRPAR